MKKAVKVVLAIMSMASMLALAACGNKDAAAAKKMVDYLQLKYGETFVVDTIGGGYGTLTTNTLKAEVYPEGHPDRKFQVEISKDLDKVWDSYMNVIMAEKLDQQLAERAQVIFQKPAWVKSYLTNGGLSFPDTDLNDKDMSVSDYVKKKRTYVVANIFLDAGGPAVPAAAAPLIDQMADAGLQMGMDDLYVDVYYLKPAAFQSVAANYSKEKDPMVFYAQKENCFSKGFTEVVEGQKKYSLNEIIEKFHSLSESD
uniref:Uncharacterized protein n=2 Tax=Paenibacillus athensensis TaxID=1967502 RepID=A0A4Y8Q773_9BACL